MLFLCFLFFFQFFFFLKQCHNLSNLTGANIDIFFVNQFYYLQEHKMKLRHHLVFIRLGHFPITNFLKTKKKYLLVLSYSRKPVFFLTQNTNLNYNQCLKHIQHIKKKKLELKSNVLELLTSARKTSHSKALVKQTHLLYLVQWKAQIQYLLK